MKSVDSLLIDLFLWPKLRPNYQGGAVDSCKTDSNYSLRKKLRFEFDWLQAIDAIEDNRLWVSNVLKFVE